MTASASARPAPGCRTRPPKLAPVADPYTTLVDTRRLGPLAEALRALDEHAELNHRYRTMLTETRELLTAPEIRLTQARGVAKRLVVLSRAAGSADELPAHAADAVRAGRVQADALINDAQPGDG